MSRLRLATICATVVLCSTGLLYSQVQTQASCAFNLFQAPGFVSGVNDFHTTVGQSSSKPQFAFIRYSGGGVSYFAPPNAAGTVLMARNDAGVSVGFYAAKGTSGTTGTVATGLILEGSTFTSFTHPKSVEGTQLAGINKYNSIVGWYFDSSKIAHGFKRYSNGSLLNLNYPGASQGTTAMGINDFGTVVGSFGGANGQHGFLYHGGNWAQVDYPSGNPGNTQLVGISNNNVAVGSFQRLDTFISFLYANGVFKNIFVPKADSTQVTGISATGVITGNAAYNDGSTKEFTATCK
jgi:hypothetical protein